MLGDRPFVLDVLHVLDDDTTYVIFQNGKGLVRDLRELEGKRINSIRINTIPISNMGEIIIDVEGDDE